jgi:hypothetical protein
MFGVCRCLFCLRAVLCLVEALRRANHSFQGVLPSVKNDYGAE